MDLCTTKGFILAVYQILSLKRGAGATFAPVCSTWVWMTLVRGVLMLGSSLHESGSRGGVGHKRSRGSTKRSRTSPLGDESSTAVVAGNLQASRVACLILLCAAKSVFWILEQPKGSLLEMHPLVQKVFSMVSAYRYHLQMGDYGGHTPKSTWLYAGLVMFGSATRCEPPLHTNESIYTCWTPSNSHQAHRKKAFRTT